LLVEIERLKAEKLKALTLKISEKGCVSVHGLGRFPVSLFAGQWERLPDHADAIKSSIAEHPELPQEVTFRNRISRTGGR
jgi:hypothetical protein